MKIKVLSLGKVKQSFVLDGEAEYRKRLARWTQIELVELSPPEGLSGDELKSRELELVRSKINRDEVVIALDERGKSVSSPQLAALIQSSLVGGKSNITFLIGGAAGWSPQVKEISQHFISLSDLTFTYQMTRLILIEQIYRSLCIINGVPYHKK